MSRSIHQTVKSVFGGKTIREINEMIDAEDPDVLALLRKKQYKSDTRNFRQIQDFLNLRFDRNGKIVID
ncbi:MAG: hypothetical protein HRU19_31190 [Pseudobacteriovorax sp.]|nr:hypothetical protein [Pseudobacteriovorax sp.]